MNECAEAGGGRVEVASGTYQLAPLQLQSNVELHLNAGALLVFSRNFSDYPLAWVDNGSGQEAGCRSPIWGEHLSNIAITGEGTIDGQGDAWRPVKKVKLTDDAWHQLVASGGVVDAGTSQWYPDEVVRGGKQDLAKLAQGPDRASLPAYEAYRPLLRPNLVRLVDCKNVTLDGVTFRNSASWNIHLALCDQVNVHHVTIFNVAWAQNGDGIDIDSCRDVTMTDSSVNAGDDGICLKSGMDQAGRLRGRPTENVTISHCTVGTGHGGVVIGSEMSGGVRHINVNDCTFNGTDNGLRFKSVRGRGGVVEDVHVNNVKMSNIQGVAILFDLYYADKKKAQSEAPPPVTDATPQFRDFDIENITCDGAKQALQIRGLPEMPLKNIALKNLTIEAQNAGFITDANGIELDAVHVKTTDGSSVKSEHVVGLQLKDSTGFVASVRP